MSVLKQVICMSVLLIAANTANAVNDREDHVRCSWQDFRHYQPSIEHFNYLNAEALLKQAGLQDSQEFSKKARSTAVFQTRLDFLHLDQLLNSAPELCHLSQREDFSLMFGLLKKHQALNKALKSGALSTDYILESVEGSQLSRFFITNLIFHLDQFEAIDQLSLEISNNQMMPFYQFAQCMESLSDDFPMRNLVYHEGFSHLIQLINNGEPVSRLHHFTRSLCDLGADQQLYYLESYRTSVDLATAYIDQLPAKPKLFADGERVTSPSGILINTQTRVSGNQTIEEVGSSWPKLSITSH